MSWNLPEPLSKKDWLGALILFIVAISIWSIGDFHTYHYSDDLIHSLNSLYQWTPLSWESDHIGSLLALLAGFIHRPYLNVLAISTLSSLLFLGGLTLWSKLLGSRKATLIESAVWVLLLTPLVVDKHRIFDNASHGSTFGSAFFFSALFVLGLQSYSAGRRHARMLIGMFGYGFLTVYLSKSALIPLAVIALCFMTREFVIDPGRRNWRTIMELSAPMFVLALALLAYQGLEWSAPSANVYGMSLSNIPASLPMLLKNWASDELTTPVLIAAPIALLSNRPSHALIGYLAAGVLVESLIISSTGWVINYHLSGYYLTDLTFLLLLTIILMASQLVRKLTTSDYYARLLPILASAALVLNAREWKSLTPQWPFTAMDRSIGVNTPGVVEAGCDLLVGDYWKIWPPALAANDYFFRNHLIDARTGTTRLIATISLRSRPTEPLWRKRLDWPDAKVCGLAGDEAEMRSYMARYAPDRALFLVEPVRYDGIIAYAIANRQLPALKLDFDLPIPGEGWSYLEHTPAGETFVWMKAESASLYLPLATNRDLSIEFRINNAMAPDILDSLSLRVNGRLVALQRFDESNGSVIFRSLLPRPKTVTSGLGTVLSFHIDRLLIPQEVLPASDDRRTLGLAFDWLIIR